jgi:hypothetical protein
MDLTPVTAVNYLTHAVESLMQSTTRLVFYENHMALGDFEFETEFYQMTLPRKKSVLFESSYIQSGV